MISTSDQPNSSLVKQVKLGKINSKKKDLRALETTLKKRISQLRELCLQEGVSIVLTSFYNYAEFST